MFSGRGAVMSATLETVTKKRPEPTAEQVTAEELVWRAREQGICARTSHAANMRCQGGEPGSVAGQKR